uniref:Membrane protein m165 n=1 Tax=Mastomys natalensis cytomegalovirus 2 TaxID=2973540 RepID=A0A9Y1IK69_9BETA|nr:membrane protein m165 [Mastomys natalensis cytomegalovirus 2]
MPRALAPQILLAVLGLTSLCRLLAAARVSVLVLLPGDRAGLRVGCRWESPSIGDRVTLRTHSPVPEALPQQEPVSDRSQDSAAVFYLPPHTFGDLSCATARPGPSIVYAIAPSPRLRVSETRSPWSCRARCELWAGDAHLLTQETGPWTVRWWHGALPVGSVTKSSPDTLTVSGLNATANPHSIIDPSDGDLLVFGTETPFECISCQIVGSSFATHVAQRCWSEAGATSAVRGGIPPTPECDCVAIAIRTGIFVAVAVAAASLLTGARRQLVRSPRGSGAVDEESVLPPEPVRVTPRPTSEPAGPSVSACYHSSPPLRERVRIRYAPDL